ncbi:MAG: lamin tail domain-containing protein, partial [Candidatus Kapaibacterium sp.]
MGIAQLRPRVRPPEAQVVINEIMPAPVSPEPEWVELYNPSADTVILQGVYLHDATSRAPIPMIPIPPGAFVVLSKDTTALKARRALPRDAILVRMTLPSLNNTGESLRLATKDSSTIDSVAYSVSWGKTGVSLERVDPYLPMHSPANCRSSTSSTGATCGSGNSVTPKAGDASVTSMTVDTSRRSLSIVVRNMGDVRLDGATLCVRVDTLLMLREALDFDAFGERTFSITLDSITDIIERHGYVQADAVIDVRSDPRRTNDSMWLDVYLSPRRGSLRVNEILYDPLGTGIPLAEFIEVINADTRPLSTAGLFLRIDEDVVAIDARTLQPGDVLAVTCDSVAARAWTDDDRSVCLGRGSFSLRSTWDSVLVTDPYGLVIDSVCYADDWHSRHIGTAKGRSLEKRSPDLPSAVSTSWTSCAATEGCTPGRPNS